MSEDGNEASRPSGLVEEVASGIWRVRVPIPGNLRSANAYVLADGSSGFVVVDCGSDTPQGRDAWELALAKITCGAGISRIVVTHGHHDHIGLAGYLSARHGAPVLATRGAFTQATLRLAAPSDRANGESLAFFRELGCEEDVILRFREKRAAGTRLMGALPHRYERIRAGDVLTIGGRHWRVLTGEGHAAEHALLICDDDGFMIAGDQLLGKLTPYIGVEEAEPRGDPLGEYLLSLDGLATLPDRLLALPGHGWPFREAGARAAAIREHHLARLDQLRRLIDRPMGAMEIATRVFPRAIGGEHGRLALLETLAHLNRLVALGDIHREAGESGLLRFSPMRRLRLVTSRD